MGWGRTRQHTNDFDLIRLVAASMVLWSHQHALMGLPEPGVAVLRESVGGAGVFIFFVISGYLNTLSVIRHRSVREFLTSRGLRIYPALIVCVVFTVLLGACVSPDIRPYFDYQLLSFIGKDITLFTGVKAGVSHAVFAGNVMPNALNGSLWTLPYEVKMYVVLALCFVAFRYNPLPALFASGCGLVLLGFSALDTFWLHFSFLFIAGSFVATMQKLNKLVPAIAALLLLACLFAAGGREFYAYYLLLAAAVIGLGSVKLPSSLRLPLDLSYAIYLYAFPIQQLSAMLTKNFWLGLLFSVVVTFAMASLSALFVERPTQKLRFLRRQSRADAGRQGLAVAVSSVAATSAEVAE
ncbi:MAG: acyltransferase [Xanthobacteraceae bacterium]